LESGLTLYRNVNSRILKFYISHFWRKPKN
jgi:hypothetical protein